MRDKIKSLFRALTERPQKMVSTFQNETRVLDMSQLRSITLEDSDLMREILSALVEDANAQINLLREAIDRLDLKECARVAHSARGACGNVGAVKLAALFSSVETEAKMGNISVCLGTVPLLRHELERLRSEASTI